MGTETKTPDYLRPGGVIDDKYRVEQLLGEGGMGVVVKATHLVLDEPVAIKFLLPDFAEHEESSERFLREAKAAIRIKSEHVTRVLDVGRLGTGEPYMVMEFMEGQDLADQLEARGPLPVVEAVDAIIQACRALADAHRQGIIHRDLKPANLFLTRDGSGEAMVKVLDFGISKVSGEGVSALTKTTTTMGSALYMSPEQMQSSRDVDARTDIYALGVTLYELLTRRLPFMEDTMPKLVASILTGEPYPLAQLRQDLPPGLANVVHRACAREPDDRYASAAELAAALAPYASHHGQALAARFALVPRTTMPSHVDAPAGVPPAMGSSPGIAATVASQPGLASGGHPAVQQLPGTSTQAAMSRTFSQTKGTTPVLFAVAAVVGLSLLGGLGWWLTRDAAAPRPASSLETESEPSAEPEEETQPEASEEQELVVAEPEPTATASASASADEEAATAPPQPLTRPRRLTPRPRPRDMFKGRQ